MNFSQRISVSVLSAAVTIAALAGCGNSSSASSPTPTVVGGASSASGVSGPTVTTNGVTVSGPKEVQPTVTVTKGEPAPKTLVKKDVYTGGGTEIKAGGAGTFQYTGVLFSDGSLFDSSWNRDEPISFSLNQVIPGWREGIPGMKEGGRRLLIVPPNLAYGSQALPGIPANSTLVFVVDLIKVN